jgi:hypothetical protein
VAYPVSLFYAALEDVARSGLEAALRPADRARLAAWIASEQDGWFFIDSVDEARHGGIKLRTALRAIAAAIAGAERRAHVVLSGRYTDWHFRQDLAQFNEELPIPVDQALHRRRRLTNSLSVPFIRSARRRRRRRQKKLSWLS